VPTGQMAMLGRKRGRNPASMSVLMLMLLLLLVSRSEPLDGFTATPSLFPRSHRHRHPDGATFAVDSLRPSRNSCRQTARLRSSSPSLSLLESDCTNRSSLPFDSPLSMSIEELADRVFQGRTHPARQLWKSYYRIGLDPLESNHVEGSESDDDEMGEVSLSQQQRPGEQPLLGRTSLRQLQRHFGGGRDDVPASIRATVADLASVSSTDDDGDGTTKLLIALKRDGRQVETVIIPWWRKTEENERASVENDTFEEESAAPAPAPHARSEYSTLCVSSQVGCRQACSFCRTGMQGLARSLTADEILAQVVLANAVIRGHHRVPCSESRHRQRRRRLPNIGNVVFMGMGEPADNARAVVTATKRLVDPHQFALPPKRITVSTVSPSPDAFRRLLGMEAGGGSSGDTGAQLAWSLHSSRNEVRKLLVPTTRHTVEALREGLIETLRRRSRKRRSVLIEMTMLDSVNDSFDDATHLAAFCSVIVKRVDGVKVVVNLIPWNDIQATTGPAAHYRPSPHDRVLAYQNALVRRGIRCYVRTTRGDDDLAACGQLSTKAAATARIDALTK
jgi:23S rRNA (adenine2503-C2)-methyltransferase